MDIQHVNTEVVSCEMKLLKHLHTTADNGCAKQADISWYDFCSSGYKMYSMI